MEFLFDPNVAFVVLAAAFFTVIFALLTPGTGFLEILALILLTLVGYSVANMAVNPWAIVLLLAGVVLVIVALRRSWKWYFLAGSILSVIIGMLFVYKGAGSLLAMDPLLALFLSVGMGIFIWIMGRNTSAAFNLKPSSDPDQVIGLTGRALTDIAASGSVYVNGENWEAVANNRIPKGIHVVVLERTGLVLKVGIPEERTQNK
jgi:membrane-bound serine protease (ClpP class)